jgi:phospholipid N-methyltransferase
MVAAAALPTARVAVEFGAGTGVITRAMLRQMAPDARLLVFETNPEFRHWLGRTIRDPRMILVPYGAADLAAALAEHSLDRADAILSGLPFQALPPAETEAILQASCRCMTSESRFVAFQYTAYQEPTFRRVFDQVELVRRVTWNVPPARVYRCRVRIGARALETDGRR